MSWKPQGGSGGPWGGSGGGNGPTGGGSQPPDIEEMLRRSQDNFKNMLPGGLGSGRAISLALLAVFALWMFSGVYRVDAGHQGVVKFFGEHKPFEDKGPGLHWYYPSPIGEVITENIEAIRRIDVGFRGEVQTQGFNRGLTPARDVLAESLMLTNDQNIIDVQFSIQWKIKDAGEYLFNIRDPEGTIKVVAESAMREVIGQTKLEKAMTSDRELVQNKTRESVQRILDDLKAGILIKQVQLLKTDPPAQVIDSFNDVQSARQDLDRKKNEAEAYANKIVPTAEGQAAQLVQQAEAYKEQVSKQAEGEAKRFLSVYESYKVAKDVTTQRLYLEAMEEIMRNSNKVIIDQKSGSGVVPYLALPELNKKTGAQ
ncbi:MAG: FtsH protease activity modulator HflK [Rhodospirillaceae bacterium]|nr:MAG: FtsH protease activity modulator HflK [Rhodospirillaceae bacterium]